MQTDLFEIEKPPRPLCAHCKAKPLIPGLNTDFCSEVCEEAYALAHPEPAPRPTATGNRRARLERKLERR